MNILVTGGAGFIGSNLVDALIARGDQVAVLDDLSSGKESNLDAALAARWTRLLELRETVNKALETARQAKQIGSTAVYSILRDWIKGLRVSTADLSTKTALPLALKLCAVISKSAVFEAFMTP